MGEASDISSNAPTGDGSTRRRRRLRGIPIRLIIPNMVTILALSAGLTAIRMTIEERYELAVYAVLAAAVLDGLDGRIARYLKSTSRFGAELDSLSDFVSFGVAPAILLYGWVLHEARSFGWIAALLLAIAGALRLARFNAMLGVEKPAWQGNFFTGVPAPAGAMAAMLPLYLDFSGFSMPALAAPAVIAYTLLVAFLMVSRIPTFSGKNLGRIRRDLVMPLLVALVFCAGLLLSFPFETLAIVTLGYLATIPLGWQAFNRLARKHGERVAVVTFDSVPDEAEVEDEEDDPADGAPEADTNRPDTGRPDTGRPDKA